MSSKSIGLAVLVGLSALFPGRAAAQGHHPHLMALHQQRMMQQQMLARQRMIQHMLAQQQAMIHRQMQQAQAQAHHAMARRNQPAPTQRGKIKPGQVLGYDASGQPVVAYGWNGNTLEIGPAKPLQHVKYIGDPQVTQTLPDGSVLYLWNLTKLGIKRGQNFHIHFRVPDNAVSATGSQGFAKVGTDWYCWVLIPTHPLSQQAVVSDVQRTLGL